jgi:hypothetical protein
MAWASKLLEKQKILWQIFPAKNLKRVLDVNKMNTDHG